MADSLRHTMSGDPTFQKYMLLTSQQEVLRRRLSLQVPSSSPMTANSPELQSLASSPTSARTSFPSSWSGDQYSSFTSPIPTYPGVAHRDGVDDARPDESKALCEINQQIKATLTELLNTESVRSDDKYRAWIQEKLMNAEHQIRRQRRRRNSLDREIAQSIADNFEPRLRFSP